MTGFLASVRTREETAVALEAGADLVDLKDPGRGALGALPAAILRELVGHVAGRRPVSATAGDLPMDPALVRRAVESIAETGVDLVKVGLFPGGDRDACLDVLGELAGRGLRLIAVLFADLAPDFGVVDAARQRGLAGVMLDTAGKGGGGLRDHLEHAALRDFVRRCRERGLLAGLAGSLGLADLPPLLALEPDYLGFRSALTAGGRQSPLDAAAVRAVRRAIPAAAGYQPSLASSARAAAGAQQAAFSRTSGAPRTRSERST